MRKSEKSHRKSNSIEKYFRTVCIKTAFQNGTVCFNTCRKVKNVGGATSNDLPSPVGIGLTDLPNIGGLGQWPPAPQFGHH